MKKILNKLILLCIALTFIFSMTACAFTNGDRIDIDNKGDSSLNTDAGKGDSSDIEKYVAIDTETGDSMLDVDIEKQPDNKSEIDENTLIPDIEKQPDSKSEIDENTLIPDIEKQPDNKSEIDENTSIPDIEKDSDTDISGDEIRRQRILDTGIFGNSKSYEDYLDFSFEKPDEIVFDYSNEENEILFAKILSGEENYRDYFDWFANNPQYILRHNKACLNLVETVIKDGKLTQENKTEFGGLLVGTDGQPAWKISARCIPANGVSYSVVLNDDWTVKCFQKSIILNASNYSGNEFNEIRQMDLIFNPIANNSGTDYYLSQSSLYIVADMGNGETADCAVLAVYENETQEKVWWTGKEHTAINYLSFVRITADFNNVFSNGAGGVFNQIYLISEIDGTWDLVKAWETYKELSLTANQVIQTIAQPHFYFL